jgi:hypothetical protein
MSCRRLYATPLRAILILAASHAYAAGPISPESDILGVNLTMSRDQAKKTLSGAFPGSETIDLTALPTVDAFKKSVILGFIMNITSKGDASSNIAKSQQAAAQTQLNNKVLGSSPLNMPVAAAGDYGRDSVTVLADPNDNATDIFAISRYKDFSKADFPVTKVLLDSLVQKYGQPSRTNDLTFTWTAPGVLERTANLQNKCYRDFNAGYLYELNGNDLFGYGNASRSVVLNQVGSDFVRVIGNPSVFDRSKCGTVLQVTTRLSNDRAYVTSMNETLIDLTKAQSDLKVFTDDFLRHANAAKQEKLLKDSQNKPKL